MRGAYYTASAIRTEGTASHRKTNKYCAIKFYNFIYSNKTLAKQRLRVNQKLEYVYDDYKV